MRQYIKLHILRGISLAIGCAFTFAMLACAVYCSTAATYRHTYGINRLRAAYNADNTSAYMPTDTVALIVLCACYLIGAGIAFAFTYRAVSAFAEPLRRARMRIRRNAYSLSRV